MKNEFQVKAEYLQATINRLGRVMGSVSVMQASFPNEVAATDPDYKRACEAISDDLCGIYSMLTNVQDGVA